MRIAVDFDGTIVENKYPQIGEEKLFAIETLKELQKHGHQIILWTYRHGKELEEAIEFCRKKGLEFYAVNKNYPEEIYDENIMSRKIYADIYIDDKNLLGFPGWIETWKILNEKFNICFTNTQYPSTIFKKRKNILKRILLLFFKTKKP